MKMAKKTKLRKRYYENKMSNCCKCGLETVVPSFLPVFIVAFVASLRVHYVLQPHNWWLLHPDEIFQSIEVAHSEIHGVGFRTYEYCPPILNITTPVEEQEQNQGMYSLRSFLYPQFFVAVLRLCRMIGITTNSYLICRITQSIITSLTPVAVYRFTNTIFSCSGVAIIASVLAASSLHLSVLGTHTLINSFISPFLFFALDFIFKELVATTDPASEQDEHNNRTVNNCHLDTTIGQFYDINSNHKHVKSYLDDENTCTSNSKANKKVSNSDGASGEQMSTSEAKGNTKGSQSKDVSCKLTLPTKRKGVNITKKFLNNIRTLDLKCLNLFVSGIILAILCYMRPDTLLFLACLGVTFIFFHRHSSSVSQLMYLTATTGSGFMLGISIGGLLDWYTYGQFFLSPIQWFRLNFASHVPAVLFGAHGPYQYIIDIFAASKSELCFHVACIMALLGMLTQPIFIDSRDQKSSSGLFCTMFLTLFAYSSVAHKEIRFVHNVLIIILVLSAYAFHGALKCIQNFQKLSQQSLKIISILFTIILGGNTYLNFPAYQKQIILPWNTVTPSDSSDINQCLNFIGSLNDVNGVFIDSSIYMTGGFSILHQNISVLSLIHHEYHEYKHGGYKPRRDLNYQPPKNVYVINRYSDIIDVTNVHYLSKKLLQSMEYNYIIVPRWRSKSFVQLGFSKKLFSAGGFSVLQRLISEGERQRLYDIGRKMPIGNNVTIMEYEASWLYTSGLYHKVVERLEGITNLNFTRVRPYQLLSASFAQLNDFEKAKLVEHKCVEKHGKRTCRKPQHKINIHNDYLQYNIN